METVQRSMVPEIRGKEGMKRWSTEDFMAVKILRKIL